MSGDRISARGLFDRVGGRERVRGILDRFYARLFDDVITGFHFAGHERAKIVDGQLAFLAWATGEDGELTVRHPKVAHEKVAPILRGHFDRRLVVLREQLETEGLGADDIDAWIGLEEAMRKHVQVR